jgi:hypothetical protein
MCAETLPTFSGHHTQNTCGIHAKSSWQMSQKESCYMLADPQQMCHTSIWASVAYWLTIHRSTSRGQWYLRRGAQEGNPLLMEQQTVQQPQCDRLVQAGLGTGTPKTTTATKHNQHGIDCRACVPRLIEMRSIAGQHGQHNVVTRLVAGVSKVLEGHVAAGDLYAGAAQLGTVSAVTSRPCFPVSAHITSHHITSHHITSHHITSHHITSHHITSHHIGPPVKDFALQKLKERISISWAVTSAGTVINSGMGAPAQLRILEVPEQPLASMPQANGCVLFDTPCRPCCTASWQGFTSR